MARNINRLSARGLPGIKKIGRHADGGNLYLAIAPNGCWRWTFLYRWRGKPTEIGLGSARTVTLARARELATAARARLAEGLDPRTVRASADDKAFPYCRAIDRGHGVGAGATSDTARSGTRRCWARRWTASWQNSTIARNCVPWTVAYITADDVLAVLQPIWKTRPETASRIRGRIERVLDYARGKKLSAPAKTRRDGKATLNIH